MTEVNVTISLQLWCKQFLICLYNKTLQRQLSKSWHAPETIEQGHLRETSNVWTFALTAWQIFSYGESYLFPRMKCDLKVQRLFTYKYGYTHSEFGNIDAVFVCLLVYFLGLFVSLFICLTNMNVYVQRMQAI